MPPALAKHWKLGALTSLVVLSLCVVVIWQSHAQYNLVFLLSEFVAAAAMAVVSRLHNDN